VSSKNKYFIVAKIFLRECTRIGMIKIDLSLNIKQFQQERKHKRHGHTTEQVRDILSLVNSYRDRAILSLLAYQGLRQCEIVRLEINDYNPDEKTLMILGKGRDDKEKVHLHENVITHLDSYIKANHILEGKLFDITTRTIRNIHSRIAKKLGIKATTHGLRHHFTTKLLNAFEGDVKKVSSFTRHKSVETVMVYNDEREVIENDLPIFEEAFKGLANEQS
jgi:integrase